MSINVFREGRGDKSMNCSKCGTLVPDGAAYCPGCATPVSSSGPGKSRNEVTREWLRDVLNWTGYDANLSDNDANAVTAKHPSRANIVMVIRRNLGMITIQSWWGLKKPGWGQDKALLAALNEANAQSWLNTFSVDKEGDLLVSAYVFLTHQLTEQDISSFLEKASDSFFSVIKGTELRNYLK
jgi:hypothetical protein